MASFSISRFWVTTVCLFAMYCTTQAQEIKPTGEYLNNVFNIVTQSGSGTATLINYHRRNCVVTVRHLFDSTVKDGQTITFIRDLGREREVYDGKIYFPENDSIDMAVIIPDLDSAGPGQFLKVDIVKQLPLVRRSFF